MKRLLLVFSVVLSILVLSNCGIKKMEDTKLLEMKVEGDPTVSFIVWFKVGSQNDPKGKEGLAMLTGRLLAEGGTTFNSYEEILDKLYPIASSYSVKVDKEMTVFYGRTHIDNLDIFLTLFKQAILSPAFKQEDFERIKSDMVNFLEKDLRYASDEELGKAALYDFIFDGTPYKHISDGTLESLRNITLDDVKAFYKQYFNKNNFVVAVGGNFSDNLPKKLKEDLEKSLTDGLETKYPEIKTQPINGYEFLLVDKDCNATAISFGFPIDVVRGDEDFFALWLFKSWFGEHRNSSSHLYQVIREERGLNYGDYAYIETFLNGGALRFPQPNNPRRKQIFEVWIRPVPHEARLFALRAALRELKKIVDNGLTKEQFEITKKFLLNYSLFYAQTTMERLGYQVDSRFYGVKDNGNYIEYFRNKIKNLTLEQVNNAIRKHIQYNNIKFAIVTKDAEKLKEDLIQNVPSPIQYPTPKPQKVLEEDKEISIFPLKVSADKIRIVPVDEMFVK
ncbi:MAG: insulinase family protein [Ignavibacteria bacterium]|nr:insulinase family protein [Ignavibacteria bacterium]